MGIALRASIGRWGPFRTDRAACGGERGGDIQHKQLLHVPRHQAALLRDGRQPDRLRAGSGGRPNCREGDGAGADEADRSLLRRRSPRRVRGREARRGYGQGHGFPY
ncbi:unnamed protein product [Linum tenue]|uniref:Uncharacterized protein n=1 Tax=Linum tenue TaxID=586396 RepID=A0AAV0NHE7_9ROSI|nr:unnamed protein product [Linum tenue]